MRIKGGYRGGGLAGGSGRPYPPSLSIMKADVVVAAVVEIYMSSRKRFIWFVFYIILWLVLYDSSWDST